MSSPLELDPMRVRVTTAPRVAGAVCKHHRQGDDDQGGSEEKGVTSFCATVL
jgi:hypothetical protein